MKFQFLICVLILTQRSSSLDLTVKTSSELTKALGSVNAGDNIFLEDGTYIGKFKVIGRSGTKDKPITLKGSKNAILTTNDVSKNYALQLNNSNYWNLNGFQLYNSQKGLVIDSSNHVVITDLYVHHTGTEAVHFRTSSSDIIFQNSTISYTGLINPGIGEGLYIGSAVSNWVDGVPDLTNRIQVLYNHFGPYVLAECIDIKEATEGHLIHGNYFDGTGMSSEHFADSWIDCKGFNNTISSNFGIFSVLDGFQVHDQRYLMTPEQALLYPSGCENVFKDNICSELGVGGKCPQLKSVKACTNYDINNTILLK